MTGLALVTAPSAFVLCAVGGVAGEKGSLGVRELSPRCRFQGFHGDLGAAPAPASEGRGHAPSPRAAAGHRALPELLAGAGPLLALGAADGRPCPSRGPAAPQPLHRSRLAQLAGSPHEGHPQCGWCCGAVSKRSALSRSRWLLDKRCGAPSAMGGR